MVACINQIAKISNGAIYQDMFGQILIFAYILMKPFDGNFIENVISTSNLLSFDVSYFANILFEVLSMINQIGNFTVSPHGKLWAAYECPSIQYSSFY